MNKISDFLLSLLFEKIPVLNLLNGYKTELGKAIEFVGAFIALLQHYYPMIPHLDMMSGIVITLSGILLKYAGMAHSESKDRRGLL
jgi:hypothetical protein